MPHVACRLSDGLGNRFFQIATLLGYAEKHRHSPVLVKEWMLETNHAMTKTISDYFPGLPTIPLVPGWLLMEEPGELLYRHVDLPPVLGNVKLQGYFQSEKYFPSGGVARPSILTGVDERYQNYAFLHIRRGDYLLPVCQHHRVDLTIYYRYALSAFADSDTRILVCSDDLDWCRSHLVATYGDLISADRWEFFNGNDYETLRAMTACGRGGITANSTFSWWGAYWGIGRGLHAVYAMPAVWGLPPLPPVVDLHPSWATVLPVA
jgi:hypothetical protein